LSGIIHWKCVLRISDTITVAIQQEADHFDPSIAGYADNAVIRAVSVNVTCVSYSVAVIVITTLLQKFIDYFLRRTQDQPSLTLPGMS
jgi:ABC-type uncharacterized transport system fused permease/ATPase subunit